MCAHSLKFKDRVLIPKDKPKLLKLLKEYTRNEMITNHFKLTETDKCIFAETYAEVNIVGKRRAN